MPDSPVPASPPPASCASPNKRNVWIRALLMVVVAVAFQLASTVMCVAAVVQFVLMLVNDKPNDRLARFSRGLGQYLRQIAEFLGFATEDAPFPFADWPALD